MSNTYLRLALPVAALAAAGLAAIPAAAASGDASYQATLHGLNHQSASGSFMISISGDQATVTEQVSGLAASFGGKPYPHVQHIHIGAQGACPTAAADKNGDGVISTTEGGPSYGAIGTTLSTSGDTSPKAATTLTVAPTGASFSYHRTFTINSATVNALKAGTGVVVVHGDDPARLSKQAQQEKSDLVPSLPLAATSPALCGTLTAMQMSQMPGGAPNTGGGSTAGIEDEGLLAVGGGLLLPARAAFAVRRRLAR